MIWSTSKWDRFQWHPWFAWRPVILISEFVGKREVTTWAWLHVIERKAIPGESKRAEYRAKGPR